MTRLKMSEPQVISGGSLRPYPTDCTESEAEPSKMLPDNRVVGDEWADTIPSRPFHRHLMQQGVATIQAMAGTRQVRACSRQKAYSGHGSGDYVKSACGPERFRVFVANLL